MPKQVVFKPYEKQEIYLGAVFSGKYNFLTYGGGKGGGKSFVSMAAIIMLCKMFAGSRWLIVRKDFTNLKINTIPTFMKVVPKTFIDPKGTNKQVVRFKNGSEVIFMSEAIGYDIDMSRFDGLELNGALLEQIEELSKKTYDAIMPAIGRNKIAVQPPGLILATINPTQVWARELIYNNYINDTMPKGWYYQPATIRDNPALYEDKAYMAQFDNMNPTMRARLIDGDWDAFENEDAFIYTFDYYKHTVDNIDFDMQLPITLSFDFNVDPMTCVARQGSMSKYNAIKEFKMGNSDIYNFTQNIRDYFPARRIINVTGDPSGNARHVTSAELKNNFHIIKRILSSAPAYHHVTLNVLKSNPTHERQRSVANIMFAHFPDIKISREGCPELIKDIQFISAKPDGKRDKSKEAKEKKGHLLDCLLIDFSTYYRKFALSVDKFAFHK